MSSRKRDFTLNGGSNAVKRERSRSRSPRRIKEEHEEDKTSIKEEPKTDSRKHFENISLAPKNRLKSMTIQMKLGDVKKEPLAKPKMSVANVFNQDSDSEPEEMPPHARMRMRNIGRDTPTSSGPNSFGKTKQGFSDANKLFEKTLKEAMESARADD
ncbi:PEST proteolytic signal-containing nuclear protein-like isoform X1 [Diorhabda carinulata]|uniref:PEST proteolytic signal-containing nuclear protein-like isoform X1 n=1 Tax=Diorhabda carinulata TaxID=1163345 RepID=UPI0025A0AEAF|nr:PEST proteolytic signal-containing nuclear protein-like isoform X1 [Diorhabda carinulata]